MNCGEFGCMTVILRWAIFLDLFLPGIPRGKLGTVFERSWMFERCSKDLLNIYNYLNLLLFLLINFKNKGESSSRIYNNYIYK